MTGERPWIGLGRKLQGAGPSASPNVAKNAAANPSHLLGRPEPLRCNPVVWTRRESEMRQAWAAAAVLPSWVVQVIGRSAGTCRQLHARPA